MFSIYIERFTCMQYIEGFTFISTEKYFDKIK